MTEQNGLYRFFVYEGRDKPITWFEINDINSWNDIIDKKDIIGRMYDLLCKLNMPYLAYFKYDDDDWNLSNYSYRRIVVIDAIEEGYKIKHDHYALKRFIRLKKKKVEYYGKEEST